MTPPLQSPTAPARHARRARCSALLLALAPAAACATYAPERSVPDPLPEVLEWALPARKPGGFLGLTLVENDSGSLEDLTFGVGLRVERVVANSPAAAAGLRTGDVVVAVNGREVLAPADVDALLSEESGGDVARLQVQRGDTVFDVDVVLAGRGAETAPVRPAYHLDPARTRAAWGDGPDGAVLVSREDDGPMRRMAVGSVVTAVDGEAVSSGRGLIRRLARLEPGARVTMIGRDPDGRRAEHDVRLLDEGRVVTRWSVPVLFTYDADLEADRRSFVLLDLWFISLLRYERDGSEVHWRVLRFFQWSSGVGELGS